MPRLLLAPIVLLLLAPMARAQEKFLLEDGKRVVFLGDSNTFTGLYISYIDAYLYTRFPDKKFELINLGLPSETVSGLSEPDHPYPRPSVHERLDRALAMTRPDLIVACFGMNDGIYFPFSDARLEKYKEGIHKLIDKVKKAGAKLVLMTPAPFDPLPIKKQVRLLGEPKYSWMKPYENYDNVLARYSAWLVTLRDKGFIVVDAHTACRNFLKEVRKKEPGYFLSGDGIHPNPTGHAIVAAQILHAFNAPDEVDMAEIDVKMQRAINGKVKNVVVAGHEIRFDWTSKVPMPTDPRWHPRLVTLERIKEQLNRHELIVTRAAPPQFILYEGTKKLGEVSRNEIKIGLDMTKFPELTANQRSAELYKLVEARQKLLGLAWLTEVGHKRPDTPKGMPLEEARKQAEKLETRIRELARPAVLALRLAGLEE